MQPFLALITPVSGGEPTHPIAPGGSPGIPTHPIYYPGAPTHPIAPGGPPLGIWGGPFDPPRVWGGAPPYVDIGFPGQQPGIWPSPGPLPHPSHPIAPGGPPPGIWGGPWYPPVIWPGPGPLPGVEHPIAPGGPEGDRTPVVEWKTAWSPSTGWIVVGVPTVPVPTPSEEAPKA